MEPEIRRAVSKAGMKLGIGLTLLCGLIGLRIVTATSPGIESGIEELERLDAQWVTESTTPGSESSAMESDADAENSLGSRMAATLRDHLPGSDPAPRGGYRLVSCDLNGRTHFTRAEDCAARGGRSTVFTDDR